MEEIRLRPYQMAAISRVKQTWRCMDYENNSALIVLPTGTGKTMVFSEITRQELERDGKVLILAHRNTLLTQAQDKLKRFGIDSQIEKGKKKPEGCVIISTVQTYSKDAKLSQYEKDEYSLIIIDEAHHAAANTYKKIIDYFCYAKLLGVTATPERSDDRQIEKIFKNTCSEYTMTQAIRDGWLCPISVYQCPVEIDLSEVKKAAGDYVSSSLGLCLNDYLEKIADEIKLLSEQRKILIFLPLVDTAEKMNNILLSRGIRSNYVAGCRKESDEILKDFENGIYDVICNAMLLTEGYDCPSVDCIVNLRPTHSKTLYTQIVGRGTRLSPQTQKRDLLVVDFLYMDNGDGTLKLDQALFEDRYLSFAEDEEEQKLIKQFLLESGRETNMGDIFGIESSRETALLEMLARHREKSPEYQFRQMEKNCRKTYIDEKNAVSLYYSDNGFIKGLEIDTPAAQAFKISKHLVDMGKESRPTKAQIEYIQRLDKSFPTDIVYYKSEATVIINALAKRNNNFCHLASYKQVNLLTGKGIKGAERLNTYHASKLIKMIAGNDWKISKEIYKEAEKYTKVKQGVLEPIMPSAPLQVELW